MGESLCVSSVLTPTRSGWGHPFEPGDCGVKPEDALHHRLPLFRRRCPVRPALRLLKALVSAPKQLSASGDGGSARRRRTTISTASRTSASRFETPPIIPEYLSRDHLSQGVQLPPTVVQL